MVTDDTASTARMQDGAYQLARLRHRYTLAAWVAGCALAVALVALALAGHLALKRQQRAAAFVVEAADGEVVARLGLTSEGRPALYLYDEGEVSRVWLGLAGAGHPQLVLSDAQGRARTALTLDGEHDGEARLYLRDEEGRDRLALGLAEAGQPGMVFANEEGQALFTLPPEAGGTPEARWMSYNAAGTRAFVQGRLGEAERYYAAAIREARALGPGDLRLAASLNNLGALYVKADKLDDADKAYQRSLEIRRAALGDAHPQLAQSLANIAFLRRAQGLPTEAESLYRDAVAMWERIGADDDPRYAGTLSGYAELLETRGETERAQALRERARAVQERVERTAAGGS